MLYYNLEDFLDCHKFRKISSAFPIYCSQTINTSHPNHPIEILYNECVYQTNERTRTMSFEREIARKAQRKTMMRPRYLGFATIDEMAILEHQARFFCTRYQCGNIATSSQGTIINIAITLFHSWLLRASTNEEVSTSLSSRIHTAQRAHYDHQRHRLSVLRMRPYDRI